MTRKPLVGYVDRDVLLERLAFSQEEVEQAALEQAKLFMAAASYRISKMRTRQEAEMRADNLRVDYSIKLRVKNKGQKGMTEGAIKELVARVPEIRQAEEELAKAKRMEEWSKLMLDAYEHRRSALKLLAQYAFMADTFTGQYEIDKMNKRKDRLRRAAGEEGE